MVGKALYDEFLLDAFFTRSFYKHMLGQNLSVYDMEDIDPEYFKNLTWILENDISSLGFNFSIDVDKFRRDQDSGFDLEWPEYPSHREQ